MAVRLIRPDKRFATSAQMHKNDCLKDRKPLSKGSCKNNFTDMGVEAPGWQGAKTQEYGHIARFRNAAKRDASAAKM